METSAHRRLKQFAAAYLRHGGCCAIATEVRSPSSRYRVDVAGYLDRRPVPATASATPAANGRRGAPPRGRRRVRCEPCTVLIECKQSRSDFLRDRGQLERLLAHRQELQRWKRHLEEQHIRREEPHLRRSGTALFADLEQWDFAASRLRPYRRLLRELRRIERQLYGETKFSMIARYGLADRLYIAAPQAMIRRRELPDGWGLLEAPPKRLTEHQLQLADLDAPPLRVAVAAPRQAARPEHRSTLLRNIAVAATRAVIDAAGR